MMMTMILLKTMKYYRNQLMMKQCILKVVLLYSIMLLLLCQFIHYWYSVLCIIIQYSLTNPVNWLLLVLCIQWLLIVIVDVIIDIDIDSILIVDIIQFIHSVLVLLLFIVVICYWRMTKSIIQYWRDKLTSDPAQLILLIDVLVILTYIQYCYSIDSDIIIVIDDDGQSQLILLLVLLLMMMWWWWWRSDGIDEYIMAAP